MERRGGAGMRTAPMARRNAVHHPFLIAAHTVSPHRTTICGTTSRTCRRTEKRRHRENRRSAPARDARLRATRAALRDADRAAVLALAYRVDAAKANLAAARDLLVSWANVNVPTGQPIDESKLDEMVWAYDLVRCDVSRADRDAIERWLRHLLAKKDAWQFGPGSDRNNHHTHQLKLQILIAAALNDTARVRNYLAQAREHARVNLDARDGVSQDYRERDALHYHAYNLEAWSEIELVTPCCGDAVAASAHFLWRKIVAGDVDHQFASSQVAIDQRRADAGHAYLADRYDSARATRAALVFFTGRCAPPDTAIRALLDSGNDNSRFLFFAVRRALWNTSLDC